MNVTFENHADALEVITGSDYWPYPNYSDILFSVR